MVRKAAKNLDGTQYSISQQFPKEINARRKALVPALKSLKDEGQRAYISADKLYVDGRLYTGEMVEPQQQSSNGRQHRGQNRGLGKDVIEVKVMDGVTAGATGVKH